MRSLAVAATVVKDLPRRGGMCGTLKASAVGDDEHHCRVHSRQQPFITPDVGQWPNGSMIGWVKQAAMERG